MWRRGGLDENGRDALAGDWRGANEEAGLPLPDHDDRLGLGRGGSQLHHDDDDGHYRNGRHRVHYHAELAVIRVGRVRVLVGYLGYGQQRQKDKAHQRDRRQKAMPCAAFPPEVCLKSSQSMVSALSTFYRRTHLI